MSSSTVDRLAGYRAALAFKAPCRVATTAAVTLSGLQTIAGVSLAAGDRVLVKNQADERENGIYIVSATAWRRARDFDSHDDVARGTRIYCFAGSNGPAEYEVTTDDPVSVGTSDITFDFANDSVSSAAAAAASAADAAASAAEAAATLDEVNTVRDDVAGIQDQAVAAAEASGDVVFFDTKAAADASLSGLAANTIVEIFADESKGGARTRYRKEGGVYVFKLTLGYDGEVPVFLTRTKALLATIPAAVGAFRTLGRSAEGDGGGARYIRKTASLLLDGTDAAGGQWSLDPNQRINAHMFGAVGDATYSFPAGTITGTDDTIAIQDMIDWALQSSVQDVYLLDKIYKTSDTLHAGWGNAFYCIRISGSGTYSYAGQTAGTSIACTATDRPVLNFSGGRSSGVIGITFLGQNANHIYNNRVVPLDYSSSASDWVDSGLVPSGSNPGGIQQHAPYVAVSVDAWGGVQPTDHYNTVTFPSWTGLSTQYVKNLSSRVDIINCAFMGFPVGVATGLSTTSQGDYVTFQGCIFTYCAYGICFGNHQSRNAAVRDCNYAFVHSFINLATMGMQFGALGGPIENCNGGAAYQTILANLNSQPLMITNLYFEGQVRIGKIGFGVSSTTQPTTFKSCSFNFGQSAHGFLPGSMLTTANMQPVTFDDCTVVGTTRIINLVDSLANVVVINSQFRSALTGITGATYGTAAYQTAINYCGGVFINGDPSYNASGTVVGSLKMRGGFTYGSYLTTPTGSVTNQALGDDMNFYVGGSMLSKRARSQGSSGFVDGLLRRWQFEGLNRGVISMTTLAIVSVAPSFSGDVMTFTLHNNYQTVSFYRLSVGSILYHVNTGTIFVVTAIGAADGSGNWPITTKQMNNLTVSKDVNGTFVSQLCSDLTLAGNTVIWHTTDMVPSTIFYGTFTSGSTNITSVHSGNGTDGTTLTTYYASGDNMNGLVSGASGNQWPVRADSNITLASVTNGSPGSATLSANATVSGSFPLCAVPIR